MAFINGPVPELVERLVTATPAQFERDLRAAWPGVTGSAAAGALSLAADTLRLRIEIEPLGVRRLGLFELPQLQLRYCFSGADERARRALLATLDRAMQKGGG